jgi:hypothetical protein
MNFAPRLVTATIVALIACSATAADTEAPDFKKSRIEYRLHSRALGDVGFPTPTDTKLTVLFSGHAAKDLFDHLRKDRYDACTAGMGIRVRAVPGDGLVCVRYADGQYSCGIGIDMKTGKLSTGMIC